MWKKVWTWEVSYKRPPVYFYDFFAFLMKSGTDFHSMHKKIWFRDMPKNAFSGFMNPTNAKFVPRKREKSARNTMRNACSATILKIVPSRSAFRASFLKIVPSRSAFRASFPNFVPSRSAEPERGTAKFRGTWNSYADSCSMRFWFGFDDDLREVHWG